MLASTFRFSTEGGLLRVLDIDDVEKAIGILMEFKPKSAADAEKA
jgi:hypothetical protein